MLMMQYSSGLSRFEVRKAQLVSQPTTRMTKIRVATRPILLFVAGIVAIVAGVSGVVPALGLAGALVLLMSSLIGLSHRWLRQMANGNQQVMVVRDGLMRQCAVAELVVGDTLYLGAGTVVPVDVQADRRLAVTPDGFTAALMRVFAVQTPTNVILAGARIATDAQVQVLAIGSSRFVFKQLLPLFADEVTTSVRFGAQVGERLRSGLVHVQQRLADLSLLQMLAPASATLLQADQATQMTLVGNNRQAAKENAFRYNQDPVS